MPLVRPCPATSPNASPSRPSVEREEIEVVAADLRRRPVVRGQGGAAELGMRRGQEGGLDAVRGVDLGLDAFALDDALHVRREVLVRVRDHPPRREAPAATSANPRAEATAEERSRARRPGHGEDERKQADEQPSAEGRRRGRKEVRPREDEEDDRDPAEAAPRARVPNGPTGGERIPMRTPNARRQDDAEREETLAVEGGEEEEKADAREEERVERRGQDRPRRGPRRRSAPRSSRSRAGPRRRPRRSGSAGTRSAAPRPPGPRGGPSRSEPPTVAFKGSRSRTASNEASRSPQRSRAKLSPTDHARKTRTESGMS